MNPLVVILCAAMGVVGAAGLSVLSIPVGMVRRTVILGNPPPASTDSLP